MIKSRRGALDNPRLVFSQSIHLLGPVPRRLDSNSDQTFLNLLPDGLFGRHSHLLGPIPVILIQIPINSSSNQSRIDFSVGTTKFPERWTVCTREPAGDMDQSLLRQGGIVFFMRSPGLILARLNFETIRDPQAVLVTGFSGLAGLVVGFGGLTILRYLAIRFSRFVRSGWSGSRSSTSRH
jgi:hypothetical protein